MVSSFPTTARRMCSFTTPLSRHGYRDLKENQRVEFTAGRGAKGPQAEEVRAI